MDSSQLTRQRINQLLYTNFLSQQNRVNGGCANRVQLQSTAGGGAMDASLITLIKNGELNTTITEYQNIITASTCPLLDGPTGPTDTTGPTDPVESPSFSYVFATYRSDPVRFYDANQQEILTETATEFGLKSNYLVKYDLSGTPIWAAKVGANGLFDSSKSAVYTRGTSVYVAAIVNMNTRNNQELRVYDANQTTPSISVSISLNPSVTPFTVGRNVLIIVKYDINGIAEWANYVSGIIIPGIPGISDSYFKRPHIYVDTNDNVYVGFTFNSELYIKKDPTSQGLVLSDFAGLAVLPGSVSSDAVMIKYSSSGIFQWYLDAGTDVNTEGEVVLTDIVSDSLGNLYLSYFSGLGINGNSTPLDFFPYSDVENSMFTLPYDPNNGYYNAIVKVNTNGLIEWGTILRTGGASGKAMLGMDSSDNLYVGAMFGWGQNLEVFNQNSFTTPVITSPFSSQGDIDLSVIKYTSAGIAQWATYISGEWRDQQPIISVNSQDKITIAGSTFSNSIDIYDISSNETPVYTQSMSNPSEYGHIILVEFNSFGTFQKSVNIGPVNGNNPRHDFQHGPNDTLYITVGIDSLITTILYDSSNTPVITFPNPTPSKIIALIKYNSDYVPQWISYMDGDEYSQISTNSI